MMTDTKNNIPALRFPEFSGEWKTLAIGRVGKTFNGLTGKSAEDFGVGSKYIQYKQIFDDSRIDVTKCGYVNIGSNETQSKVEYGDTFFTTSSETPNEVGYSSVLLDRVSDTYLNSFCFGYRPDKKIISPSFARFLFRTPYARKPIMRLAQGSTRYNMSKSEFLKILILLPSLSEQDKIAIFLSAVDARIGLLKKKKEQLEAYKRGAMQQIFSRQIRFKDSGGKNYPEWETKRLKDVAGKSNTKNRDSRSLDVLSNSAIEGIVKQADYFDNVIANENNTSGYYVVRKNDFVYNPRISKYAPYGPIKRSLFELGIMSPLYTIFRFVKGNSDFWAHYFESTTWHRHMYSVANFGVRFDRMNISNEDFFNLRVPYPCPEEQQKIADFLSAIDKKIELCEKQIADTEKFKKGLLQQMFV